MLGTYKKTRFSTNHSGYIYPPLRVPQTTEFCQTTVWQCERQWL